MDDAESFRQFLLKNNNISDISSDYLKKRASQKIINDLEKINPHQPYLATILDLNKSHLPLLKEMCENAYQHLIKNYCVNVQKDIVEMFFHFPYPDSTTTLHMHIRVNQIRHPFEKARSFALNEVIDCLENNEKISNLIMKKGLIYQEEIDVLDKITGIIVEQIKNPYHLLSPNVSIISKPF